jgi:hypothetical protein
MGEGGQPWLVVAIVGVFLGMLVVGLVVARRGVRRLAETQRALAEQFADRDGAHGTVDKA